MSVYAAIRKNVESEFADPVADIKRKPVEEIVDAAHQLAVKQEMFYLLSNESFLHQFSGQLLAKMAGCPYLLDWLYCEWLYDDYSLTTEIKGSITNALYTHPLPVENKN